RLPLGMDLRHSPGQRTVTVNTERFPAVLLAMMLGVTACGSGQEGEGSYDPLIEEAPSVAPSGTGPGNEPVPPGIPLGGDSRGPGAPISGESGDSVSGGPAADSASTP